MANSTQQDVGIKQLADKLGTQPRELRKFVRSMDLGVGRGGRYSWPSLNENEPKRIAAAWRKAHKEA